jgi:hypothetical protein
MVRFFSSTNTGAVLSDVEVPLLCIRLKKFANRKRLVLPLGSELKIKALKKVLEIKMAGADIKCLYVKTSKSDVRT